MSMRALVAAALLAASPASAEVRSVTDAGFESVHVVTVAAPPTVAYQTFLRIGSWWSGAHSYSGDAANMSIDPRPGGCFCEATPANGGAVEHMRVVYLAPGSAIRLRGALGPLQEEGVDGALTATFEAAPGGGTRITVRYVVGGYVRAGIRAMAAPVDQVLGQQVARLKAAIDAAPAMGDRRRPG